MVRSQFATQLPTVPRLFPDTISSRGEQINMANLSAFVKRLKKERDLVERQLTGLNAALAAFVGLYGGSQVTGKRKVSAAARRKMSLAQKARWAKVRTGKKAA